ncbi:TonB-dependent receptor domain-containing protein [Enterobacter hormaechei]
MTLNSKPIDDLTLTWAWMPTMKRSMPTDSSSTKQSGGERRHGAGQCLQRGRYPGYSITNLAPFLQASYDIDAITLSGGVRYQYTENKVDDFVGYAQQQAIATGKATSADAVPGGKPTTTTSCLTPGSWTSDRTATAVV